MPGDEIWNREIVVFGWGNGSYSSVGASDTEFGEVVLPFPDVTVDKANNIIDIDISRDSLGEADNLNDVIIYVTTWDMDDGMNYKPLVVDKHPFNFSGAKADPGGVIIDPLVWDDIGPFKLSVANDGVSPGNDDDAADESAISSEPVEATVDDTTFKPVE